MAVRPGMGPAWNGQIFPKVNWEPRVTASHHRAKSRFSSVLTELPAALTRSGAAARSSYQRVTRLRFDQELGT